MAGLARLVHVWVCRSVSWGRQFVRGGGASFPPPRAALWTFSVNFTARASSGCCVGHRGAGPAPVFLGGGGGGGGGVVLLGGGAGFGFWGGGGLVGGYPLLSLFVGLVWRVDGVGWKKVCDGGRYPWGPVVG